ncbi:MAG TPA: sensor histidine kinase [Gemmatimonadaceae bacterium]|nr:sensor histidine kinase [Gemmatimonadaceae bacterium]
MRTRTLIGLWSLPAWYTALNDQVTVLLSDGRPMSWGQMIPPLAEWYIWVPLTPIVLRLADRFPISQRRTWPIHAAAIVVISVLRGAVYTSTSVFFAHAAPSLWLTMVFYLPFAAAIYGVIVAIDSAARLQKQLARAELVALRANLQPHFLFNALHSVGALVRARDNDGAVLVISELSDLLRAQLRRDAPDEVTLRDEIAFVERYLAIEQVRFRDRLRVRWEIAPDTVDAIIPRLLLQPLAENAIRHGIGRSSTAGLVVISSARNGDWLEIVVTDDGPGPSEHSNNGGLGLATARARLRHAYGPRADITLARAPAGGARAVARVPFRDA